MSQAHSTVESFGYAFHGIKTALKLEPNFRIHSVVALLVILVSLFLGFNLYEWVILLFTIFLVLVLELINTAMEEIVDIVSPEVTEKAKIAKDVTAAAVFLSTSFAVIIGIFLFLPKIFLLLLQLKL